MSTRAEDVAAELPRNFIRSCLLLLLREDPAHGYDLLQRLAPFGLTRDPGRLYRALRSLEAEDLVHSSWERSTDGPDRRIYVITRPGLEELHRKATGLAAGRDTLGVFLSRYTEFVELGPAEARTLEPEPQGR